MIAYGDLEKALIRWKLRTAPPLPPARSSASGVIGGKKLSSSLDWSMDQAMGTAAAGEAVQAVDTSEIMVESADDTGSTSVFNRPADEATEIASEIDVTEIEE